MADIRNYGVGTGWSSDGITGRKYLFSMGDRVYAEHVYDNCSAGDVFKIVFYKGGTDPADEVFSHSWTNTPGYSSIFSYAYIQETIKREGAGKYYVKFFADEKKTADSDFKVEEAEIPTPPTPPEKPATMNFDSSLPYTYMEAEKRVWQYFSNIAEWYVYHHGKPEISDLNVTEEQWAELTKVPVPEEKASIYITSEPAGASIFADGKDLGATTNFTWFADPGYHEITVKLSGYEDMTTTGSFAVGYWEPATMILKKIEVPPEIPWYEDLAKAAIFLSTATHPLINIGLETLLKLPGGEAILEKIGMYGFNRLVEEAPEFEVLRKSPKGSVSIAVILGIVSLILGIGTVVGWLRKEAPEPSGMAVWAAIEARDWETANTANKAYRTFVNTMNTWLPVVISWFNPFLAAFLGANRDSQLAQADAYKKIIDAELAVKTGTLTIRPIPADAKVSVEGQIPTTGIFSADLEIGSYVWTVSKFGYTSKSGTIELTEAGLDFSVEIIKEVVPPEELEEDLTISVAPDETKIFISGHPEITKEGTYTLPLGPYTIYFSLAGYRDHTAYATLKAGKPVTVSHSMIKEEEPEPEKAELLITSKPSFADVVIDGKSTFQKTPYTAFLDEGTHTIRVELNGYEPEEEDISLSWGDEKTKEFILNKVPPTKGTLRIVSDPPGAFVYIDGSSQFVTTPFTITLDPETYKIRLTKDGYLPDEADVSVEAGVEKEHSAVLQEEPTIKATITITSEPTEADIYIDGKYQFVKTPYTVMLDPKDYIFRIQKDGYFPIEIIAEIEEGEVTELPFVLEAIPVPEIPPEPYIPYEPYYPTYTPPEPYVPSVVTTPTIEVPPYNYSNLWPEIMDIPGVEPVSPPLEKELLVNIETTDVMPTKGRIYSIAFLDLTTPGSEIQTAVLNDEEALINGFIDFFEAGMFTKLVGYNVSFDYRYIFTKMMKYRRASKVWKNIKLRDIMQIMKQVKEEFVFGFNKPGTLDAWGKMLLGKGKYGSQELILRKYIQGDFDYVKAFQNRQIELSRDLYSLARFVSSEAFISSPTTPVETAPATSAPEVSETPGPAGIKQCPSCFANNPLSATECEICKAAI